MSVPFTSKRKADKRTVMMNLGQAFRVRRVDCRRSASYDSEEELTSQRTVVWLPYNVPS